MKKISEMLNWFRDEVTGIEEVTNLLPELDAIIREAEKRENYTQSDVYDKLQAAISDAGIAYNPYDNGWNAAIRFAIAELELSNNQDEAGAAWQQSRLLDDELVGRDAFEAWALQQKTRVNGKWDLIKTGKGTYKLALPMYAYQGWQACAAHYQPLLEKAWEALEVAKKTFYSPDGKAYQECALAGALTDKAIAEIKKHMDGV